MKLPKQLPFAGYWGSVLMLAITVWLYHQGQSHLRHEMTQAAMLPVLHRPAVLPALPDGVGQMVGGRRRHVFVGGQLGPQQLTRFLASYDIRHVIDLAAEAKAEAILPTHAERMIVEKTGATYWPLNIEGTGNRLNQRVLATIDSLVDLGEPLFVHCLHGIHRVGVVKGRAYARDLRKWNDIVGLLGWEKVITIARYDRYTNDVWEQVQQRNHPPRYD